MNLAAKTFGPKNSRVVKSGGGKLVMRILLLPSPRLTFDGSASGSEEDFKIRLRGFLDAIQRFEDALIFVCGPLGPESPRFSGKLVKFCEEVTVSWEGSFPGGVEIAGFAANFTREGWSLGKSVFVFDREGSGLLEVLHSLGLLNYVPGVNESGVKVQFLLRIGGTVLLVCTALAEAFAREDFQATAQRQIEEFRASEDLVDGSLASLLIVVGTLRLSSLARLGCDAFNSVVISSLRVPSPRALELVRDHLSRRTHNCQVLSFSVGHEPVLAQASVACLTPDSPLRFLPARNLESLVPSSNSFRPSRPVESFSLSDHPTVLALLQCYERSPSESEFLLNLEEQLRSKRKKISKVKKLEDRKKKFAFLDALVRANKMEIALKKITEILADPLAPTQPEPTS